MTHDRILVILTYGYSTKLCIGISTRSRTWVIKRSRGFRMTERKQIILVLTFYVLYTLFTFWLYKHTEGKLPHNIFEDKSKKITQVKNEN